MSSHTEPKARCCEPPPARLVLCLLGPPQALVDGELALGPGAKKALALLAYLALEADRPHPRASLAALFWPDRPEKQALQTLRQTLTRLRRAIDDRAADPPHLLVKPQRVQFNRQSDYWLDVEALRTLVAQTESHPHRRLSACPVCLPQLTEAVAYYRGEFLARLHPAGSLALDEWLLIQREKLQQRACVALQALASSHLAHGEPEVAREYARQLLRLDPWNEAAQQLVLHALALSEGRNAALQHYHTFRAALAGELGVEPEDSTLDLVEQIRSDALAGIYPNLPSSPLPTPITPLVGRDAEQAQIAGYLAGQSQRLITLYGPGGSGKSRLVQEVAAAQAPLWRDGVWFVPLDGVPASQGLLDALATALDLRVSGESLEARRLTGFLRPKELLLVLDGFEHLVDCTPLLEDIMRSAPQVRMLVTSRTRLGLPGEWTVEVLGLDVPAEPPETEAHAEDHGALQLFVQNARRVDTGFRLSQENLSHIVHICQRVAGLPLGIELAASWVRLFPCRQIAGELEQSLDFLHDPNGRTTDRHHSLRATFDYSYRLLSETQKGHFRKLSVFRGGFTTEAAREIAGTEPSSLVCLADRSLLQLSASKRMDMHLTLREYAAEKLAESPEEEEAAREQHSRFYLGFLRQRDLALEGTHQEEALGEIGLEHWNVRVAWSWAAARARIQEIEASTGALSRFYDLRGLYREAEVAFGNAADGMLALAPERIGARQAACLLLAEQSRFLLQEAQFARASQVAETSALLAHAVNRTLVEATARRVWGEALWRQGSHGTARAQLERALCLARSAQGTAGIGDRAARQVETDCLSSLGAACWIHGDRDESQGFLHEALEIAKADGRRYDQARLLTNLGVCAVEQGDYTGAGAMFRQSLRMRRAAGDLRGESITLGNLGNLLMSLGAYDQARSRYEKALHIQREIGARNDEALSVGNLSLLHHYLGYNEIARDYARRALQIAREIGERRTEGAMWMKLGHALAALESFDGAANAYQESVTLRREMGWPTVAMEPLAGLARIALAQGDVPRAQAHVEDILEHLETGGTLDGTISPFQVYLTCYRVLEASGDPRHLEILATAHGQLQERAARITDEKLRHSFLENVAAHRELHQAFEREREAKQPG